jgi:hypothetical protein
MQGIDVGRYAGWVADLWHGYSPEGGSGHTLILAGAS